MINLLMRLPCWSFLPPSPNPVFVILLPISVTYSLSSSLPHPQISLPLTTNPGYIDNTWGVYDGPKCEGPAIDFDYRFNFGGRRRGREVVELLWWRESWGLAQGSGGRDWDDMCSLLEFRRIGSHEPKRRRQGLRRLASEQGWYFI